MAAGEGRSTEGDSGARAEVGYALLDEEGRLLDANPEYLRLTGRAGLQEIQGARIAAWTAPRDLERSLHVFELCREPGRAISLEVDFVGPGGENTPVQVQAVRLGDTRLLTLCRDLSRQRTRERVLLEIENAFRLFLEHSPVYVFFKDADLRPIYLSRNYEQMLGRPLEQVLGRTMDELFPPELAEGMIADDRRILQQNALVRVDEEMGGKYFTTIKFPVAQEGKPAFLAGFTLDITERKQAELALRESEARFRAIFEQTNLGMAIVTTDGHFVLTNPAFQRFMGYAAQDLLGMTFSEVTRPDFRAKDEERVSACLLGEIPYFSAEKCYVRKDGQEVWGQVHVKLVRDDEGAPRNLIALVEDISEQKRNEEERRLLEIEVQHAQKLESLGSLAGGVAHDMNNVLQAIQGMASVLRVKVAQDPALTSGLDIILNASRRGRDLVKDLTDFARKGLQEPRPLDLNELIRKEVELLRHTTLQRIELRMELEEPLPSILGDPSSLGNALMNLCVNAIDASQGKGVLVFRSRRLDSGSLELSLEDSGQGMSPEVLARAAEPFFTTKPIGKGTGLGLSSVYGTMKAHGGSMDIQSEEGRGTRVSLRFPIAEQQALPINTTTVSTGSRSEMSLKMLLIDDDELIRDSFPELMEILGHHVVATAANGHEGIRLIEEGLPVDVIVLDHNMPGLSGIETLSRLQVLRPGTPIVFCTGHLDDSVRDKLRDCAKVWVLMKPYSIKDIRPLLVQLSQG